MKSLLREKNNESCYISWWYEEQEFLSYTKSLSKPIPKPMIKVCGKPIIHRIVDHFHSIRS